MDKELRRKELLAEAKKLAKKIAEEYKPEKIILFGSAATGEVTEDSDVDLFVVKDTKERRIDRDIKVRRIVHDVVEEPLDVVVYTPYEVGWRSKGGDPFVLDVLEEGRVLSEEEMRRLDSYCIGCRYPGDVEPNYEDATKAIKIVEKVKRFVEREAGLKGIKFDGSWWEGV